MRQVNRAMRPLEVMMQHDVRRWTDSMTVVDTYEQSPA